MNKVSVQIKRSFQEQMLQFNIDWSLVCNQAIERELKRLSNKLEDNNLESLIDIDVAHNNSEIANFNSPEFPRKVYQVFKNVWQDCFSSTFPQKKPPTSQQIKQLWKSWYTPLFDEAEWWENWDNNKKEKIENSVSNAYSQNYQYTTLDEQNEFLLDFDAESLNCNLDPIYTAFIEFVSKFIFNGELVEISNLTPFHFKSVNIEDKDSLPEEPGIYFVVDRANIYYIGMSTNIQKRWYSHHKQPEIDSLSDIRISYLDCLPKHYLKSIETTLICHFKPSLNISENPLYKKL